MIVEKQEGRCMKNNILFSRQPAQWHRNLWREGFVSGNGCVGINVLGAIQNETVVLQHFKEKFFQNRY